MLESFLMRLEVIFLMKKQRELEKNFVEQKLCFKGKRAKKQFNKQAKEYVME